ncbi:MAG TPA: insulinase family protein, partial [Candidatus Cloacimonetes bacterium]|nr:insulinase family protein [Candidatus Cloacimonadota bacterium]
ENIHKKYFMASQAIVTLFGDLTLNEAELYAKEFYNKFPRGEISATESHLIIPDIDETFMQEYAFEPVNIDLNCVAPPRDNDNIDHWTMKVIMAILNGSRGRIHKAVRGTNDLAYYGYARYTSGKDYGFFRLTSQTSVDKKDELVAVLQDQIDKLKYEPVTREEIQSSVDDYSKMVITSIDDNRLPYFMTQYEAIGLGYNYLDKMKSYFDKVTPEDIQRVANEYFTKVAVFISQPNAEVKLMVQ